MVNLFSETILQLTNVTQKRFSVKPLKCGIIDIGLTLNHFKILITFSDFNSKCVYVNGIKCDSIDSLADELLKYQKK